MPILSAQEGACPLQPLCSPLQVLGCGKGNGMVLGASCTDSGCEASPSVRAEQKGGKITSSHWSNRHHQPSSLGITWTLTHRLISAAIPSLGEEAEVLGAGAPWTAGDREGMGIRCRNEFRPEQPARRMLQLTT